MGVLGRLGQRIRRRRIADYAPTVPPGTFKALVASVVEGSPAADAGLVPGCLITRVDGEQMRDIVDWFWLSDGFEVEVEYIEPADECNGSFGDASAGRRGDGPDNPERRMHTCTMVREPMQEWGFEFADNVFDGVITCRNACIFCFMKMLPEGMRSGMYLRDDDYRLSFLQGNFVTLTNMTDADVRRVVDMGMSPLHMSIHALDPSARLELMGRNHARGLEVAEQLLAAGIDLHLQAVVVPGVNEGSVLLELATWAARQEHVLSLGVVPLGFTRYQDRFEKSFDDSADALAVLELLAPVQERCRAEFGITKIHLSDEFYVNAYGRRVVDMLPPADHYDGYPQFQDGIGMLRSLVDDWRVMAASGAVGEHVPETGAEGSWLGGDEDMLPADDDCLPADRNGASRIALVCGRALEPVLSALVDELGPEIADRVHVLAVENVFFGGNVDVSGLLTGEDVVFALASCDTSSESGRQPYSLVLLPGAMFNSDGLTLDNMGTADISQAIGAPVRVICYSAEDIFGALGLA